MAIGHPARTLARPPGPGVMEGPGVMDRTPSEKR
jgi:hypothetical protein